MINKKYKGNFRKWLAYISGIIFILLTLSPEVKAQEDPPRPPSIIQTINLGFGAFYHGPAGGTVIVDESGGRTTGGGDIVLLGLGYPVSAAHFNIYSNPGTLINILSIPDFNLTSGANSMKVEIGDSNPDLPFVNNNPYSVPTELTIGAVLNVGNPTPNPPPGNYNGTFEVTLVME
ncbi:MAG TPA: DUF4402 domain-containing protein [Bacteroidales bacterium]|jgi:hypothetical protein|nr:DUF4402 domain-containing protein [Bacteroidales bacterium]OQB64441.1 MAG: hypothetical protein BWX96_00579 [Bacteroidetes bacterium ADurb.Bin145]NMD01731.1 DUF4402 domain-containing protein [Bacteroidales bacterium]HOU02566.1 DUF4402 domain-containing protein [Bacteroidales bacterium]HQG62265.1 DUF4402 domain-containing protein [Bacteroidales bacterium]